MKVLITGAGGFIGSHLVESQLEQGNLVWGADINLERLKGVVEGSNLTLIDADITDTGRLPQLLADIDVVYHLASAHLDVRLGDEHYRQVNVAGSVGMLEAAMAAGVQRFVHCSSVGVIGDIVNPPADETTECRPTNIYEKTKLEGERAVLELADRFGYPVVVARPAWVYGPRDPRTEKMLRALAKGRFPIFGAGRNMRHPVFIQDLIRGLERCADPAAPGGRVFILAGESPVEVRQLIQAFCDELGVSYPKIRLPLAVGQLAGIIVEPGYKLIRRSPPFSRRSMDFFVKNNAYDITEARRVLGFRPQVDLHSGIRQTIRWQEGKTMESYEL
ncbi:MAG: NAD(P)-dependent oxidoreductase [Anaerolineales bacterium]|nr:NAD(P)-dependent oxidoreductase [Anaerolineales bacterium]